jgi:putative oxidoreductase
MKKAIANKRIAFVNIVSALFIFLFVYTALNKFLAVEDLKFVLKDYPLIGSLSEVIAWGLPIIELFVSVLLLYPKSKLIGLFCSLLLMTGFTLYLGYMLTFTTDKPCTCGGMLQQLSWPQHIIFNISFIILSVIAIRLYISNSRKRDNLSEETAMLV